jgi:dipeptidyl aminopeptidase/acylaminoacyl peptidase
MKKIVIILTALIASGLAYFMYKKQENHSMNTQLISREVLFGNPEKTMVRLSSNGQQISYLANFNGVLNIFTAKIEKPHEGAAITNDTGRGIRQYFWLYTNQHIAYLKDDGGDENWRIHVVNISTNEDKIFTPEKVNAQIYHVSDKFPEEILVGLNDRDPAYHDAYRLNILTGEKILILQNDRNFSDFIFDDDYNLRFATITTEGGGAESFKAIPAAEPGKYTWESFMKVGLEDVYTTQPLGLTNDGNILYMLDSRGHDLNVLKEINLITKVETVLAQGKKADIGGVMSHPHTGVIEAYSTNYLCTEWTCLDKEIEVHFNTIKQTLKGEVNVASRTLDDNLWVVADLKDDGPTGYYLYQKAKKALTFLFNQRENLTSHQLAKMEGVVIKARDGLELPSYLTKPINVKGPVPLILLVHGGPVARDDWGYDPEAQWLANRGYAVLQVNYRASTGFGKSFISKGDREWGAKMHEDLLDAVSWAIKEGIADPAKIAIYGGSYGGYAALWGAAHSGDVFKCAVDIVGPSNLQTLMATIPPYWKPFLEQLYQRIGDNRTEEGLALLKERSPLTHVDKIHIPVLIAQGEKDPRVKQAESEQIVAAMKAKNLGYIYMLFMDEGHGFARPENKFAFYAVAERFLADNLGGKFEVMTNEFEKTTLAPEHKTELVARFNKA